MRLLVLAGILTGLVGSTEPAADQVDLLNLEVPEDLLRPEQDEDKPMEGGRDEPRLAAALVTDVPGDSDTHNGTTELLLHSHHPRRVKKPKHKHEHHQDGGGGRRGRIAEDATSTGSKHRKVKKIRWRRVTRIEFFIPKGEKSGTIAPAAGLLPSAAVRAPMEMVPAGPLEIAGEPDEVVEITQTAPESLAPLPHPLMSRPLQQSVSQSAAVSSNSSNSSIQSNFSITSTALNSTSPQNMTISSVSVNVSSSAANAAVNSALVAPPSPTPEPSWSNFQPTKQPKATEIPPSPAPSAPRSVATRAVVSLAAVILPLLC